MDEILREFAAETIEHLTALDRDLVRLEQNPNDADLIHNSFRSIHNIKGTCSFLGLNRLGGLLHAAESVLGKIRDGALVVSPATIGVVLDACDRVRNLVGALDETTGLNTGGEDAELIARLEGFAKSTITPELARPLSETSTTDRRADPVSIRVNLATIENLMATVSELVLTRNQLMQMSRRDPDSEFALPLQHLSQLTTELQESVMKTRMQPIGHAWAKLPRVVRDLAGEHGKKIELKFEGAETELDRQVLELIRDPLTHMVRNAVDHGIETPEQRIRAGKPDTGTITLSAGQEGGAIIVTLSDDGNGVDLDNVRRAARAVGIVTEAALHAMNEQQLHALIFQPGFTTASEVSALSGRGVGLDVVRTNIEKIGGAVELSSFPGRGARFTIKIPLTLAIVPSLILNCAGQRFAMPQTAIAELVRARGEQRIEWLHDAPVMRLRGQLLPLMALQEVLGLGRRDRLAPETYVAVISVGTQRFGIMVDGIEDAEEIVVKRLSPLLRGLSMFAGSTILGDGRIIMILDPHGLAVAVGAAGEGRVSDHDSATYTQLVPRAGLLLFRAGEGALKAVPLESVTRIEEITADQVEWVGGNPVMQYRGAAIPLVTTNGAMSFDARRKRPVLVLQLPSRTVGLLADEVLDAVEDAPSIDADLARPGILGTSLIAGKLVEIVDDAYYASGHVLVSKRDGRSAA